MAPTSRSNAKAATKIASVWTVHMLVCRGLKLGSSWHQCLLLYVPVPVPVALANCARAIIMAVPVAVGPKSCEVAAASAHMGPYTNLTLSDSVQASELSEPADEPAEASDTASKLEGWQCS